MIGRTAMIACALGGCLIERDPPPCAAPHALTELNTNDDENNPMLSKDRLEIVFSRSQQLVHADRIAPDAAFSHVTELPLVNGSPQANAFDPWLSADGTKLRFVSGDGNTGGDVYSVFRDSALPGAFDTAHAVLDSDFANLGKILHPSLSDDELELVFAAPNPSTSDPMDLWFTRRPSTTVPFPKPAIDLAKIDASGKEGGPSLTGDGQLLVYDTTSEIQTRYRIATATRSGNDFVDATPVDIPDLMDSEDAESPWGAPNGRSLVFARQQNGVNLDLWIYCE